MSISDVMELYDGQGSTFYYVDRIGFQQVEFLQPEQEAVHTHTMQL